MHLGLVELSSQSGDLFRGAPVRPEKDRRDRLTRIVKTDKAVPETGETDRRDID
jgi:hypothetical protein